VMMMVMMMMMVMVMVMMPAAKRGRLNAMNT
jgi:hypothetical protein